jgi:pimeloyl-ACP methyl ester carboxylesterase
MTATVVLVHGAWHGAWCFDRVVPLLQAAGVPSVAVDLPGHGLDPGPFTDLHGDAARVGHVLDRIGTDVVLLGHSYGGAVVTEAGVHETVRHLVYLCAFPLDEGESCAAAATSEAAGLSHASRPDLTAGWVVHGDGTTTLDPKSAAGALYNDCDAATIDWAIAHLGPQPMENLSQPPAGVGWRSRPSTYVVCTEDGAVHPGLQEALADRCTERVVWPTSHSPFASRPAIVAELLVNLAAPAS